MLPCFIYIIFALHSIMESLRILEGYLESHLINTDHIRIRIEYSQ